MTKALFKLFILFIACSTAISCSEQDSPELPDNPGGCVKTLAQPLLYFTVLLYFLLAMLLFPHAFGNKLLYSNYIGL